MKGKGFIVIHEEDDLIRELLERWLGEAGYSVCPVTGESPLLVIADVPSPRAAPSRIEASHRTSGTVARTRPLCPFGQVARWNGSGSTDDAANFACKSNP